MKGRRRSRVKTAERIVKRESTLKQSELNGIIQREQKETEKKKNMKTMMTKEKREECMPDLSHAIN